MPKLGFVPTDQVRELFEAADAAVVARRDGGTSGALVLALSLGVPVVASSVYAGLVGDAGWLYDATDDGLVGALARAVKSDTNRMADRALERSSLWTWDVAGSRTAALFAECVA